ncbi:hypothetical protein U9R89_22170 [Pectobacterium brasiliense]
MKREITVTANETRTFHDKKNGLTSIVELRIPPEDLEYFSEVLQAQENDQDVRSTLIVRTKTDGSARRLPLTLKNSKMKDFVPVAIFTKFGQVTDNLTQLFDTGWYGGHELLLIVEVVEERDQNELDFNAELAPVTPTWVLAELQHDALALERLLGEGCPHCPAAGTPIDPDYARAAELIAGADYDDVCNLLAAIGIDHTDWDDTRSTEAQDLIDMRSTLLFHWRLVAALELREAVA